MSIQSQSIVHRFGPTPLETADIVELLNKMFTDKRLDYTFKTSNHAHPRSRMTQLHGPVRQDNDPGSVYIPVGLGLRVPAYAVPGTLGARYAEIHIVSNESVFVYLPLPGDDESTYTIHILDNFE